MSEQAQAQPTPEETPQGAEVVEVSTRQDDPKPEPTVKVEAKYTDKDVDKLKGQARKEARERAEREILERYGFESFDDLENVVETHRSQEEANATETEKERKAREKVERDLSERQSELDSAYARIAQMTEDSALRDALAEAGAKPNQVATLLRLADRDALDVDDDGNLTGVAEQIEALQGTVPELFNSERPGGVGSTGGRDERPSSMWDLPDDEFKQMQQRVANGERVVPPRI
jgi:hypothetical protein